MLHPYKLPNHWRSMPNTCRPELCGSHVCQPGHPSHHVPRPPVTENNNRAKATGWLISLNQWKAWNAPLTRPSGGQDGVDNKGKIGKKEREDRLRHRCRITTTSHPRLPALTCQPINKIFFPKNILGVNFHFYPQYRIWNLLRAEERPGICRLLTFVG